MWPKKSIGLRNTLGRLSFESFLLQPYEDSIQVFRQLLWCLSEDYDVIEITDAADVQKIVQDNLHEPTEWGWCVGQAEGHPC